MDMIFSLRQLQEKCREQKMPLFIAFIDLTKAFDLVSRDGLFKILEKIGCPPKLQSLIESFHNNMKGTVQFDGNSSEQFDIHSGVKQGCVLAPTLFGIFFSIVLKHAFDTFFILATFGDGTKSASSEAGKIEKRLPPSWTSLKGALFDVVAWCVWSKTSTSIGLTMGWGLGKDSGQ